MVGNRHARFAVPFTDETAFGAEPETDKTGIADHDPLEAEHLFEVQRRLPGPTDGTAPPLDAVLGRMLALDREARSGVLQEKERRRPGKYVLRHHGGGIPRACPEVDGTQPVQGLRAEDERAECRCAGQVVLHPVPAGGLGAGCELPGRFDDRRIASPTGIRQVQSMAGQPLVQEPDASRVRAGRLGLDQFLDWGGAGCLEEALQDGKVEPFVLESEGEVRTSRLGFGE